MRTIIAGSRSIVDYSHVYEAIIESGWKNDITEVVSGGANGVDKLGERFAREHDLPISRFPANWKRYGKQAGYMRNQEMVMYGDALIAVWDMRSKGTRHMIDISHSLDLAVFIWKVDI